MGKKIKLFEDFTEAEKKETAKTAKPWDALVVGDVYSVYDMENNGKVLYQSCEYQGEKNGKLAFKSLYLPHADVHLVDKDEKYSFIKKAKPKAK